MRCHTLHPTHNFSEFALSQPRDERVCKNPKDLYYRCHLSESFTACSADGSGIVGDPRALLGPGGTPEGNPFRHWFGIGSGSEIRLDAGRYLDSGVLMAEPEYIMG